MAVLMTGNGVSLVWMLECMTDDLYLTMIEAVQRPHLQLHHIHLIFPAFQILMQFQHGLSDLT